MNEFVVTPHLEKRILPLLDVALSLVGVLILMVSVSSENPSSGIEGNVVRIQVNPNGDIQFGEKVLATNQTGINEDELQGLMDQLAEIQNPLVLLYYSRPSDQSQSVNEQIVFECVERFEASGCPVRIIGEEPTSESRSAPAEDSR